MAGTNLPTLNQPKTPAQLALRQQDAGYAKLAAVALPASCQSQHSIRILRLPDVMKRVGICRASIYAHMATGAFPKQISLGARSVGWLEHEIDAWLAMKIHASGKEIKLLTDY